jgi:hypothetical protein
VGAKTTAFLPGFSPTPYSTLAGLWVDNNHGNPLIIRILVQTITTGGYPHSTLTGLWVSNNHGNPLIKQTCTKPAKVFQFKRFFCPKP